MTDQAGGGSAETRARGEGGRRVRMLQNAAGLEETYADGAVGALVREAVFKLDLYRVVGPDPQTGDELWQTHRRLVMPLNAAPQLLAVLQRMVEELQKAGRLAAPPPSS